MYKILTLDGGGSKGMYSLGVLHEIEAKLGSNLINHFDAFYGTSTGAIIATMLARGKAVSEIKDLYSKKIPLVMSQRSDKEKSSYLKQILEQEFAGYTPYMFTKLVGVVSTSMDEKAPKIFKTKVNAAHQTKSSFKPFFGYSIPDALVASCAATPFFCKHSICNEDSRFELLDGGFCANNPTLFALVDAFGPLAKKADEIIVVNVGTGEFPVRETLIEKIGNIFPGKPARFLSSMLEINSNTTALVTKLLFGGTVKMIRFSEASTDPELATNFLEKDLKILEKLYSKGRTTFRHKESEFATLF